MIALKTLILPLALLVANALAHSEAKTDTQSFNASIDFSSTAFHPTFPTMPETTSSVGPTSDWGLDHTIVYFTKIWVHTVARVTIPPTKGSNDTVTTAGELRNPYEVITETTVETQTVVQLEDVKTLVVGDLFQGSEKNIC